MDSNAKPLANNTLNVTTTYSLRRVADGNAMPLANNTFNMTTMYSFTRVVDGNHMSPTIEVQNFYFFFTPTQQDKCLEGNALYAP